MAAPNSYTEEEFKQYLAGRIGSMADHLKWTVADGDYDEAVNDALLYYGQSDITKITGQDNIQLLRAYGRYAVWKSVAEATVNQIDYTHADSGATYKHHQMYDQALGMMKQAADDVAAAGGDVSGLIVDSVPVVYENDLYTAQDNSLNASNEWSRVQ